MKKNNQTLFFKFLLLILMMNSIGCKNGVFSKDGNDVGTSCIEDGTVCPPETNPSPEPPVSNIASDTIEVVQSRENPKLDMVIVVDTSESMNHNQAKLGAKFGQLISSFDGLDWQMAFINADNSHPKVSADGYHGVFYNLEDATGEILDDAGSTINILTSEISNPHEVFLNTINRKGKSQRVSRDDPNSYQDSGTEAPLNTFIESINLRNNENSGFFRQDSTLATIILSNEDEFSDGQPTQGTNDAGETVIIQPKNYQDVFNTVTGAFGSLKSFVAYGIIVKPGDEACRSSESSGSQTDTPSYSTFIHQLVLETKGQSGSICDSDYSQTLSNISSHLEAKLTLKEIELKSSMIADSIEMTVEPEDAELDYEMNGSTMIFNKLPAEGTTITITYNYTTE